MHQTVNYAHDAPQHDPVDAVVVAVPDTVTMALADAETVAAVAEVLAEHQPEAANPQSYVCTRPFKSMSMQLFRCP